MQINFTLPVIFNAVVIILGLFVAIMLLFKPENKLPNRLMSLILASTSLWLVDNFMRMSGIYAADANMYFKPIYYSFAFGPLVFFYVKSITNSNFKFEKKHWLHFIPVLLQGGLYWFLTFQDYSFKRWYWLEVHSPVTYRIEFDGSFISLAIYLFLSLRILRNYQLWLDENHSETSKITLNWLVTILSVMFVLTLFWFVEVILRDFYADFYSSFATLLALAVITIIFAIKAFYQEDRGNIQFVSNEHNQEDSEVSSFDENKMRRILERMEVDQDYLESNLNLKTFASNCKLPQKLVSQYLNQKLGKSFHTFVNEYRVEEFKRRLKENSDQKMTIEGMAYESGFNSKASFNRIFKKFTGTSPSKFVS